MFPHLLKQYLRKPTFKWRFRVTIPAYSIHYDEFQYTTEITQQSHRYYLNDPSSYAFSVQSCLFPKIIILISRTLQAVKTCMGSVLLILAWNQFLFFSQVPNMFEIGCCQSLHFCLTGKSNGFTSVPILPHTAVLMRLSGSHTKPVPYLCIHQGSEHWQCFFHLAPHL